MANKTIKLLTNQADFPALSTLTPREAFDNADASPRMPGTFYGAPVNADFGQPQIIYCENVLPSPKGVMSAGYTQVAQSLSRVGMNSLDIQVLSGNVYTVFFNIAFDVVHSSYYPSVFVYSSFYQQLRANTYDWLPTLSGIVPNQELANVTVAYVDGRSLLYYPGHSAYIEYIEGTDTWSAVTPTYPVGTPASSIIGICAASNYLIAYSETTIYWGSPLNSIDFSSINAGAGNQIPIDLGGKITSVRAIPGGFIVYTSQNAVAATFTNNATAPFIFKAVSDSGGIIRVEHVTTSATGESHIIWGTKGLQQITRTAGASPLFPEMSQFLSGTSYELWDPVGKSIVLELAITRCVRVEVAASRYLVLSYGIDSAYPYTYHTALIYDLALKRWGKLVHTHERITAFSRGGGARQLEYVTLDQIAIDYSSLPGTGYDQLVTTARPLLSTPAAKLVVFTSATFQCTILEVEADYEQSAELGTSGLVVFGHVKQRHDRTITLQNVNLDGVNPTPTPIVTVLGSTTGRTRDMVIAPELELVDADYRVYGCRETFDNFDVAIEGSFVLSSALLTVMVNGYR